MHQRHPHSSPSFEPLSPPEHDHEFQIFSLTDDESKKPIRKFKHPWIFFLQKTCEMLTILQIAGLIIGIVLYSFKVSRGMSDVKHHQNYGVQYIRADDMSKQQTFENLDNRALLNSQTINLQSEKQTNSIFDISQLHPSNSYPIRPIWDDSFSTKWKIGEKVLVKLSTYPYEEHILQLWEIEMTSWCGATVIGFRQDEKTKEKFVFIHMDGWAREGSLWYPEDSNNLHKIDDGYSQSAICPYTSAQIAMNPQSEVDFFACSITIKEFCEETWKTHPSTFESNSFDCFAHGLSKDFYLAQEIVSKEKGICPSIQQFHWIPDKITHSSCSMKVKNIAQQSGEESSMFTSDPLNWVNQKSRDLFFTIQDQLAELGFCPPTEFRWLPDTLIYHECHTFISKKCVTATDHCLEQDPSAWEDEEKRIKFFNAQIWAAGLQKCPPFLFMHWVPGPKIFPDCTEAMHRWCNERNKIIECDPSVSAEGLRQFSSAQQSAYEQGLCPHPKSFLWSPLY